MNLGVLLGASPGGRVPSSAPGDGAVDTASDTPEGVDFATLLETPAQPWASTWQAAPETLPHRQPAGHLHGADPEPAPPAGDTPDTDAETEGAMAARGTPRGGAPDTDTHAATERRYAAPGPLPGPATALPGAPGHDGIAPEPHPGGTADAVRTGRPGPLPDATPPHAGGTRPVQGDGSLAVQPPPADGPADDLPARTLAMLDDVLQRPVRMLAAGADAAQALQAAQPTPEVLPPPVAATPPPLPAPQPREMLPGHLNLTQARTPDGNETAEQLNARLNWMASHQVGRAQIRVSPPQLGTVEIDIEIRENKVRADFGANNAEVRAMLEAGMPRLREMFSAQGLNLVHSEVSSSLPQGQGQQADTQGRQGHPGSSARPTGEPDDAHRADTGDGEASQRRPMTSGRGLVDEFA